MNLPQIVAEIGQTARQLQQIINANLQRQRQLIQTTTTNNRHQLINQLSEKTQIYSFQLPNLVRLFSTHFVLQNHPEPICKINKLTEKFLTSEYDFTDQQVMGLRLYSYTYDWQRIPEELDFQLMQRIVLRFTLFNHFHQGYSLAFRQLTIMMQIFFKSDVDHGFAKMVKNLHIMHKFKIVEININAIKQNHHLGLQNCLQNLHEYLMIVAEISRDYVKRDSEVPNSSLLKLNESDTNIVNDLGKLFMDFVPQCLQLMHTSTDPQDDPQDSYFFFSYLDLLSQFQRPSIAKKTYNIKKDSFKLQPLTQHNKLSPFQQQLAELMYQHGIVDWIMTNSDWLASEQFLLSDDGQEKLNCVLTVMELIVFRVTVKEFGYKLCPLILNLLLNSGSDIIFGEYDWKLIEFNWLIEFVHCNAKPQNASLFRDMFVESQLLKHIEYKLQRKWAYLEDNVLPSRQQNIQTIGQKSQRFIYRTILAIAIYRACDLPPSKVVLISAEIVLKFLLNCCWLNEYIQIFLSQHPFDDNKMEIEN